MITSTNDMLRTSGQASTAAVAAVVCWLMFAVAETGDRTPTFDDEAGQTR